jgi:hypothetical protein
MRIHDWSRVFDGAFHDFHTAWNIELRNALNGGILPPNFYALTEQVARPSVPDVLTLQTTNGTHDQDRSGEPIGGAIAVATAPPRVRLSDRFEPEPFTRRQKLIAVRHTTDDRIIAVIEILSAGNKSSNKEFHAFLTKAVDFLDRGIHLLLFDIQPRTNRDPEGIHPAVWAETGATPQPMPPEKPLTLGDYDAGPPTTFYVEPVAVGDALVDMPLFLAPDSYVSVPLAVTYEAAFRGAPRWLRDVLELPTGDH